MIIVKIEPFANGSHENQEVSNFRQIPSGYAVLRCEAPHFPFGKIKKTETVDNITYVTHWEAGVIPPEPTPEESTEDLLMELAADHEERICLLELGV